MLKHFLHVLMSMISAPCISKYVLGLYLVSQLLVNKEEELAALQDLLSALLILQPVTTQAEVQVDMMPSPTQNQIMRKEGRGHTHLIIKVGLLGWVTISCRTIGGLGGSNIVHVLHYQVHLHLQALATTQLQC